MKILYGVQGTGNGHIARARAMSEAFKEHDVQVDFLFSGREPEKYFSMEAFGDYQTRRGFTFVTEKGSVNYTKTALNNNLIQFFKEVKQLDLSSYDLVINDFEPVSAWAARKQNKPCIGISHQNAFRYPVPLKGASWFDKSVIEHFAPSRHHLGISPSFLLLFIHLTIHQAVKILFWCTCRLSQLKTSVICCFILINNLSSATTQT